MSPQPGRRSAPGGRGGLTSTGVLAVLLPAATVGTLLLVQPHEPVDARRPPEPTTLKSAAVACPSPPDGPGVAYVGTAQADARGKVTVTTGGKKSSVPVRPGQLTRVPGTGPVVVEGEGDLAPGLLGGRFGDRRLAAVDCALPAPETWFTGVGAGTSHNSVLELTNPDAGPAVADVTVLASTGEIVDSGLRGVTVPGDESVRLDLSEAVPRRTEMALRVSVSRGRLAASVLDEVPQLGSRRLTQDWLAPQPEPAERNILLGLPSGAGAQSLAVANPGEDEVRASVKILTADAAFAPEGLDELRVPPGSVQTLDLSRAVREAVQDGAIGIEVTSTGPVTAGSRAVVNDDLSLSAPVQGYGSPMSLTVPPGRASVLLADADGVGTATITSWNRAGRQLAEKRVELKPGTGGEVRLPAGAALVRVTPRRTSVHAALMVSGDGATVVPFHEQVTEALIPDVRPGLP
ncbi:MAG TPA: DUF5719 family protein [Nocardioides sp.]|nr:DUF5719 family protein [Nocardioides sp.]